MNTADRPVLRIGAWRVDPALDEISKDGETVKLEPRAMRVLICLAERPGQVVSVEQLLDAVWKDVIVTPDSVYQAVAALRRALGDVTKEPVYIANVLRRGYRLVAPVAEWSDSGADSNSEQRPQEMVPVQPTVNHASTTARVRWSWVLLLVVAAVAIGYPIAKRLVPPTQSRTSGTEAAVAGGIDGPSVAVLPFIDMSDRRDQGYFTDGLSDVLIDRLARVPGLQVPARTSSFYFKDKQATISEIAKALGVAHLLMGSVRKSGNTLRITARLVRADKGYQVWSETFDRPLTDAFKVQDEIAEAVAQVLKLSILGHYVPEGVRTTNIEAYTLYFQAENIGGNGPDDYDAAIEQLHAALALDPQFAAAWARLADSTIWRFDVARVPGLLATRASPTKAACADARAAADRALALDSTLVETHRAKGIVLQYCDSNWPGAEREFRRALELQPGSSDALRSYAWLALADDRPGQALELARRALSLDPLNCWNFAALGDAQAAAGRFTQAEAAYRNAVGLCQTTAGLHAALAYTLLSTHKTGDAVAEAERETDSAWRETALLFALDAAGRQADADRAIAAYERSHSDDPGRIAAFYACRRDTERSIRWLGSFAAKHEGEYHDIAYVEACFGNLQSDNRYRALLRDMKAETHRPTRVTSATGLPGSVGS